MAASLSHRRQRPKVGFALGGGRVRGAAHVGVPSVLEEAGIRADMVAGTSAGAIVGAAYAAGLKPEEMLELLRSFNPTDVARVSVRGKYGLLDTTPLAESIDRSLGVDTFDDLDIPLPP